MEIRVLVMCEECKVCLIVGTIAGVNTLPDIVQNKGNWEIINHHRADCLYSKDDIAKFTGGK